MKDRQIREILQRSRLQNYLADSDSKVVDELALPVAKARVDIAVINGHLHAYEIKGASDTLKRLPSQLEAYAKVFDYVTVVTEEKYVEDILCLADNWIGVLQCSNDDGGTIKEIRRAEKNTHMESFFLANLLWNHELEEVLKEENIPYKKRSRSWLMCEAISRHLSTDKISAIVRERLKYRTDWKVKLTHVPV